MSTRFATFALAVSTFALLAAAPAAALETHVLENVRTKTRDGDGEIFFKRIEIVDTNLTRDEVDKILSPSTDAKEVGDIVGRMQARRLSIPEAVVTRTGERQGTITLRDHVVENLDNARFDRLSLGGMDGRFKDDEGGEGSLSSGKLVIEDADFSSLVAASKSGDASEGVAKIGGFNWSGFKLTAPDKDTPATAVGGNVYTIAIGSVTARTDYDGLVPLKTSAQISGVSFIPPRASRAGQTLANFGYEKIELGAKIAGSYDPSSQTLTLTDYTISGVDAGALGLAATLGDIDSGAFAGEKEERLAALLRGSVDSLRIHYVDQGLFEKALAYYAATAKKNVSAVRSEWSTMVTGVLPMLLAGDPAGLKLAEALGAFIRDPKNLTISLKSKGEPIPFMDLMQLADPAGFLSRVDVTATANR